MIATMEYVSILDYSEEVAQMILASEPMEDYIEKKQNLAEDQTAQALIIAFTHIKEQYEDVKRFGRYHPDYHHIMKEIRVKKRELDVHETVAAFKVAERNLQMLLDEISSYIATSVSEQIKAPKDGAALSDSGCSCSSGGSGCGCSA